MSDEEQCTAALNIKGEHFPCDQRAGHSMAHSNRPAEAIWQGEIA